MPSHKHVSTSKHKKKWADKKRRPLQFRAGDQVLIKLRPKQIRFRSRKNQRLVRKYEGTVEVLKKIEATYYRVAVPTWMTIHPVILLSNLKPYHPNPDDEEQNVIMRPSIDPKQRDNKEIEEILVDKVRKIGRLVRKIREFLFKWKNLPTEETSWERAEALDSAATYIARFKNRWGGCHGHACSRRVAHGCMPMTSRSLYIFPCSSVLLFYF